MDDEVKQEAQEEVVEAVVADDNSTVLLSLDEMIKLTITGMDRLKEELTQARDMVTDALNNDAEYKQHDDAVKAATKERTRIKKSILERPGMAELVQKVSSLRDDLKDKDMSLSDYAEEYSRLANVNQIELPNGEILEIIQSSKVVRKRKN